MSRTWFSLAIAVLGAALLAGCKPSDNAPSAPAGPMTQAQLQTLEAQLKGSPADTALKDRVAEGNFEVGHAMMMNPELDPKLKYRGALKFFRRALELNPKHEQAANEKKTIEDIYIQMRRPIPK